MVAGESVDLLLNLVRECHAELKGSLREFEQAVVQGDRDAKLEKARNLMSSIGKLKSHLATTDRPEWLPQLENSISWYINNSDQLNAGTFLFDSMLTLKAQVEAQTWDFDSSDAQLIDFAGVYRRHYLESRIPELFDSLIQQLEVVIASGELDSVRTITSLQNLIATVQYNRDVDLFAAVRTWQFAQVFLRNVLFNALEDVPVLGTCVKALRDTMDELEITMAQVDESAATELRQLAAQSLPVTAVFMPNALPPFEGADAEPPAS